MWNTVECLFKVQKIYQFEMTYLYRDASRVAYVLGPPPARGGDLELEAEVNVFL